MSRRPLRFVSIAFAGWVCASLTLRATILPIFLGGRATYSAPAGPETALVFEGESIPVKVIVPKERDRSLVLWTSGEEAFFAAAFETEDGRRAERACVTWVSISVDGRTRQSVAPTAAHFEVPPDHLVEAIAAVAPCGGLAPGRYILRMGSASRALLGGDDAERPSFYASEALEYRRVNGAADQLDKHRTRVMGLMITEQWEDAARTADAALRSYPNAWVLHYDRAVIAEETRDYARAIEHVRRALAIVEERSDVFWVNRPDRRAETEYSRMLRQELDRLRAGQYRKR